MSVNLELIVESIPAMLTGFGVTLQLLFVSGLLGLLLAIILLLMRLSGKIYLDWPAQVYIYIFRGTPILVQIFIIYYGLPQFEAVRESVFWPILREPTGCAILALTLNTGAYVSEILRGGVLGVDKGLLEAGSALGMSARGGQKSGNNLSLNPIPAPQPALISDSGSAPSSERILLLLRYCCSEGDGMLQRHIR